jgi:hypothetical protein
MALSCAIAAQSSAKDPRGIALLQPPPPRPHLGPLPPEGPALPVQPREARARPGQLRLQQPEQALAPGRRVAGLGEHSAGT